MKILIVSTGLGEPTQIKILEKKVKSIIVKFNSWKSRQQFYNARRKHFNKVNGNQVNIYLVYRLISQEGDIYY